VREAPSRLVERDLDADLDLDIDLDLDVDFDLDGDLGSSSRLLTDFRLPLES
jgi:hypothetical protein